MLKHLFSASILFGNDMENSYCKGNANEVNEDIGERGITSWDIALVDFVSDGHSEGNQTSNEKTGLVFLVCWVCLVFLDRFNF